MLLNTVENKVYKLHYHYHSFFRKREDENVGDYKMYKRRSAPEYFQYACELRQMMRRVYMKSIKNIHQSSLDTVKH
jgi:hypothetical protein